MICSRCGKDNDDKSMSCFYCGNFLSQAEMDELYQSVVKGENTKIELTKSSKKRLVVSAASLVVVGLIVLMVIYMPKIISKVKVNHINKQTQTAALTVSPGPSSVSPGVEYRFEDPLDEKYIEFPISTEELIGLDYEEIKSYLVNSGFTNVVGVEIKKVVSGHVDIDQKITEVVVNGSTTVNKGDIVDSKAEIIITYQILIEKNQEEPTEISMPISSHKLINVKYYEVETMLVDMGFTNIVRKELRNITAGEVDKINLVDSIDIAGVSDFKEGDSFASDSVVTISYNTYKIIELQKSSDDYLKRQLDDVKKEFEDLGFTYIEIIERVTYLNNYKDNEIVEVTISNKEFDKGDKFSLSAKVSLTYSKYEELYTIKLEERQNIKDLKNKIPDRAMYSQVADSYLGEMVEFDAIVENLEVYDGYWNMCLSLYDHESNKKYGPTFWLDSFKIQDIECDFSKVNVESKVRVIVVIDSYNIDTGYLFTIPFVIVPL